MTCHDCREKLLRTLDPSAPSTEVAAHLALCDDCRQYQQRLTRIEGNVARIPVPPSRGSEAFRNALRQLTSEVPVAPPMPATSRQIRRPFVWVMTALAASALLAAVGLYWSLDRGQIVQPIARQELRPEKDEKPSPFVAQLLACDLSLAEGASLRERTKALAMLAGLLEDAIESKPNEATLQALAKMHHDTLVVGLLPIAQRLPQAERAETLTPIIGDLVIFHEQVVVLAPQDPAQNQIAQHIAQDIRDARHQLRNLLPAGADQAKDQGEPRKKNTVVVDWQRDLPLIEAMVATGRKLGLEENPLQRARQAHDLAEKMGGEIQRAAQVGDGDRAAEYGQYVHALLTDAVAKNMTRAQHVEKAPSREDLDRFARAVSKSTRAIEADLKRAGTQNAAGMDAAHQAVSSGRIKVENSVKEPGIRK